MPRYLVGTDLNYYTPEPLNFSATFIVTADSPYSRPALIQPFDPSDDGLVEAALRTTEWMDETSVANFTLWDIWSDKTVVTDLDGNIIYWEPPNAKADREGSARLRRTANRG